MRIIQVLIIFTLLFLSLRYILTLISNIVIEMAYLAILKKVSSKEETS